MANVGRVYKNWPKYDDDLVNKAYVDEATKNIEASDELAKQVNKNSQNINSISSDITNLRNEKLDSSIYEEFIAEEYNPLVSKISGTIESYYQSSDPSSNWSTAIEKETHVGDIW